MMKLLHRENLSLSLYAFVLTVLYILLFGYRFNTGDLSEHLPQVYRMIDPDLYRGDFFMTQYDQTFTVRFYWIHLVYGLSLWLETSYACFVLYVVSVWFTILAWIHLARIMSTTPTGTWLSPVLLFFVFRSFTLGGNQLLENQFASSIPAEAIASWGVLYWFRDRKYAATVLWGLSCSMQVLVGLQWMMLFAGVELISIKSRKELRQWLIFLMIFAVVSAPILIPVFYTTSGSPSSLNEFYILLYYNRAPWHYIPHLFPPVEFLKFGFLLIAAAGIAYFKQPSEKPDRLKWLAVLILAGCLIYTALIEFTDQWWMGKLQWFKTTCWLSAIASLVIGNAAGEWFHSRIPIPSRSILYSLGILIPLAGFIIITQSAYIPIQPIQGRYQIGNYLKNDLQRMHEWILNNTPADAMFLTGPENESFSCEARRPTPVNYKALIHQAAYFMEWKTRISQYYQIDFGQLGKQTVFPVALFNYRNSLPDSIASTVDYRIDNLEECNFKEKLGPIVHREGNWVLTKPNP